MAATLWKRPDRLGDAFTFAIVHKALYEYMQALDHHLERVIGEIEASAAEALATARA
jgi:hypothetical protein